jgi:hypothetical protein
MTVFVEAGDALERRNDAGEAHKAPIEAYAKRAKLEVTFV